MPVVYLVVQEDEEAHNAVDLGVAEVDLCVAPEEGVGVDYALSIQLEFHSMSMTCTQNLKVSHGKAGCIKTGR